LGTVDDLRLQLQIAIRQFAKEQLTWFRRDGKIIWLDPFGDFFQEACRHIGQWGKGQTSRMSSRDIS
jgi:tRNA A37 N6-isopentenylltransferase MiaA